MTRVPFIGSAAVAIFVGCAGAVTPADRPAHVDAQGVMRWDDGSEVAVFGVNYYAPFALDYRVLRERGHDIKLASRRSASTVSTASSLRARGRSSITSMSMRSTI